MHRSKRLMHRSNLYASPKPPNTAMPRPNGYAKPPNRHANSPKWLRQAPKNRYGKPSKWLRQAAQKRYAKPSKWLRQAPQMARFINVTSLAMANFKRRQALVFAHDSSHANPLRFGGEPFDALFDRNVDRLDIGQF